jgi:hypothetical protein
MNNRNPMFDSSKTEGLDKEIKQHMARPTLVGQLKEQNKRKKASEMTWRAELEEYWYVYLFLGVSALFTGTLGAYMGMAPYKTPTGLFFQTDTLHIFLALVYTLAFITNTEGAFALAKRRYFTREEKNDVQKWTMLVMMMIAGISIIGTGIAGGMVIASNISFLTEFIEVPPSAQKWVVIAIPVLLAIYTFLVTAYHLSSDAAASERITREQIRERDLDHRTRQRAIEQIAQERLQETELQLYLDMVAQGRISSAQAKAAIQAGKTLGQLEKELGRDIDGNKHVGSTNPHGNNREPVKIFNQDGPDFPNPPKVS